MERLITNICSNDLEKSKEFYTTLFDLSIVFDSDWYIQLKSEKNHEIGLIKRGNEIVPPGLDSPDGIYLTFVVENVDYIHEVAKSRGFQIIQEPEDTFYGQRRLLIKDPNGCTLDISSLIK